LEQTGVDPGLFISKNGEPEFRKIEREILVELLNSNFKGVIASGGGTPCFSNNMDLMLDLGTPLFLDLPLEILTQRINDQVKTRHWLREKGDILSGLIALEKVRRPFYLKSKILISSRFPEDQLMILKSYCPG
jgi:shikimate kinase